MDREQTRNRPFLWAAIFVGGWTALAVLSAVEVYIAQLAWDKPIEWKLAFLRSFKDVGSFALLSLSVIWLCKRVPFKPDRWQPWLTIHVFAAIAFALSHVALVSFLTAGEKSVQTGQTLTFSYLFGKLAVHYTVSNFFKYWIFVVAFLGWHYYKGYREREIQAVQLNEELTRSRLHALRMQLNPHFLFNTLNAISALIHDNPEAADRMLVRLSELLRLSLDQEKPQEQPLREELAFLNRYLEIEKIRFCDRLQVEQHIQPDTCDALVPSLILQPIVENAIRHGVEPCEGPGRLVISAERIDSTLHLCVRDNGPGLPLNHERKQTSGIGLSNTRSRLAHLYGDGAKILLKAVAESGLEVQIELPFRTEPRNPDGYQEQTTSPDRR